MPSTALVTLAHAPTIEGVRLHKVIGRGAESVVILASRGVDSVAVKTSREPGQHLSDNRRRRFLREGCLLACLTHPALPRIFEVGESDKTPYIVLEYVKGETLQQVVASRTLSSDAILGIATELADALAQVHDHGLIHRDIHPANILLDDARPRLIDFGLAADAVADDAQRLEGTLRFMAPEQGGMLDRLVDHRSDLYSLGAVLYYAATGKPPFDGEERHEILTRHATAPVPDPLKDRPDLDPTLAAILQRLLAKDPSDRFPSAGALLSALQNIKSPRAAVAVDHGVHELVGRRAELQQLLEAWDHSQNNNTTLVIVEGPSGSGKSRLIHELLTRAASEGAGTFSITIQPEEPHPFAPLQRLFDPVCDHIDQLSGDELMMTADFFLQTIDHRLDALQLAVPRLARQLAIAANTDAPAEVDLRSDVVYDAMATILQQIASNMNGALIAIDNAQWLDDATERVLQRLDLSRSEAPLLILLGADDSQHASPRTTQLAGALRRILHNRVALSQLTLREVDALIRARLAGADVDITLVERIFSVSGGNAYAVESFIRTLLDAAVLRPSWGRWTLDTERLQKLDLPDDMAELLHFQLDQLPSETRDILTWIALFGVVDHPEELALCAEVELGQVEDAFAQAGLAGLLRNLPDQGFSLIHNSLRQRLLDDLDPAERHRRHQAIALTLDQGDNADDHLFDLARHYALGLPHLNPDRALNINHKAGMLAMQSFAYQQAFSFLREAARIAEDSGTHHATLDADLGRIAARTGHLDMARKHLSRAIEQASDPYLRAQLRGDLANVDITNLDISQARRQLESALGEIGESIPRPTPKDLVISLGGFARGELTSRIPLLQSWLQKPVSHSERRHLEVLSDLYNYGSRIGYFTFDDELLLQIALRQHELALRLNDSALLARTHSLLGFMSAMMGRPYWSNDHARRALEHAGSTRDRSVLGMVHFMNAMTRDFEGHTLKAERMFEESVMDQGQWLDAWEYASGSTVLTETYALRGHHRRALSVAHQAIRELHSRLGEDNAERQFVTTPLQAMAMTSLAALGQTESLRDYEAAVQRYFAVTGAQLYYHAVFHHSLLMYCVERQDIDARADRHIEGFEALPMNLPNVQFYLRPFYVWKSWIYLLRVERALERDLAPPFSRLKEALAELDQCANVPLLRAYHHLFSGFLALYQKRTDEVGGHFEQARRLADDSDMPLVHFELARGYALLYRSSSATDVTSRYVRQALQIAQDQGWSRRLRRLRADFAEELRAGSNPLMTRSSTATRGSFTSTDYLTSRMQQQFDALLRIHQVLSDLGTPQTKLNQVLDELIAIFGAERGFFFHVDPDDERRLLLEATRHADNRLKDAALPLNDAVDALELAHTSWADGIVQQVFATQRPLVVHNVREGARWDQEAFDDHLRSAIAVPMISRAQTRGVVYLDSTLSEGVFAQSDIRTLQGLTNSLAVLLEAARTTRLEAEVARATEKSASLLEHATSAVQLGLAITDPGGLLISASPTLHTMAEPWGSATRWWSIALEACDWQDAATGLAGDLNLKSALADVRTPDNLRRIFELTDTGSQHQLGEHANHSVFLVRDVTSSILADEERQRLNEDLELATEQALSANRAKSTFLANMSHELRTPLNAIIGYAEMLLEEHSPDEFPALAADLDRIQVAGKHLLRLVSDILDLSKIEAGHIELLPHEFSLAAMIDDVAATARQLVESNHNTLTLSPIPDVTLFNDETRLRQILLNLLGNAAKFTEDGNVTLTISLIEARHHATSLPPGGDPPPANEDSEVLPSQSWLAIKIADSGIGMTPDELERLFEAFYQADQRSISRHGGTGLGLTITRRFCDLMGGSIHVESTPGEGTTFTIEIPTRIDPTLDPDLLALQNMVD
ncbi:GAF domain-containing protein [Lujinxingia sediminis]|uniref:histidine kinase n=1 Tax=Lujinxingia sediminis TaxID=2480984 RepID=A0ABY0CV53_9DELT|nr:ATP-binding protein [Lujinxingia sediminis]RVU46694.1 GAF domain-containing protein [Lujinxingia sediminis]